LIQVNHPGSTHDDALIYSLAQKSLTDELAGMVDTQGLGLAVRIDTTQAGNLSGEAMARILKDDAYGNHQRLLARRDSSADGKVR
jgi:hypothetical protein